MLSDEELLYTYTRVAGRFGFEAVGDGVAIVSGLRAVEAAVRAEVFGVLLEQQRPDDQHQPDGHWAVYGRRMARVIDNFKPLPITPSTPNQQGAEQ